MLNHTFRRSLFWNKLSSSTLIYSLTDETNRSHLEPQAKIVPFSSIDGAVKRRRLSSVDLHPLYSQEMRSGHCGRTTNVIMAFDFIENIESEPHFKKDASER